MITIFSRIRMNTRQLVGAVVFVLIATTALMVAPALVSVMIDDGVSGDNLKLIIGIAIAMVAIALIACAINMVAIKLSSSITTQFSADLRKEIFHKVQSFSAAEIDRFGTSSLITRNTADVTQVQNFLSKFFQLGIMAPMMTAVGLVLSVGFSGKIAVVLAISVPILIIAVAWVSIAASRYSVKLRKKIDDINQLFLEALEGVRVIRAFNKQEHEIGRFKETNEDSAEISRKSIVISGTLLPLVNMLFGLTSVGSMMVGTALVIHDELQVGSLVAVTQYINMILLGIILLAVVVNIFPDAYACMQRIAEVLETEVTIKEPEKKTPAKTCKATVEFRNVTFAYPGADAPVVNGINFVSKPGEMTAIIGRTGCGKSSIVKLIPRLYDTLFGDVLVDGVNVRDYKLKELRDLIGYVPQKNVLFSGDIASNLNFGDEEGTEEDWEEAVRIACAAEFVEKKDGVFHSPVAQGGTNFSGGQRQRLAIARAVMKKPEIYIFDDSFSALDMKTDRILRKNLMDSMGDATMIIIAQRVNTIMDATRILVLEDGEVIGMGTHKELLKSCKLYREIAEIQLGEEEVKNELASA